MSLLQSSISKGLFRGTLETKSRSTFEISDHLWEKLRIRHIKIKNARDTADEVNINDDENNFFDNSNEKIVDSVTD